MRISDWSSDVCSSDLRARCRCAVQHPGFGNHAEEDRRFACRCARRRPADAHDVRRAVRMWRASNRSSLRAGVGCARLLWSSVQAATTTGRIEENTMSVSRFLRARLCLALFALAAASGAHAAAGGFLTPEFLLNTDHRSEEHTSELPS